VISCPNFRRQLGAIRSGPPAEPMHLFETIRARRDRNVNVVFRFARDSLLEGDGFEPSVPPREKPTSSPVGTRSLDRLAAGTGCRLQQATVSAYSNVSNGAEREPPDLRISLLAGAHAVGPGQQVAAAGLTIRALLRSR
jgi:hypothetical protein